MANDFDLLREYAATGSEEAFRTLVERHSGMVHGVATRVAGEAAADEIAQAVFIILARKAATLGPQTLLAGWLFRTARFVALESLRGEKRRRERQEAFSIMTSDHDDQEADSLWKQVSPVLEDAMHRLGEVERNAVILRFLEGQTFAQVAGALGISEAAAKMRVGRAVEKLRANFQSRGITATALTLTTALDTHALSIAPAALAKSLSAGAIANFSSQTPLNLLVNGGLKAMAISKTKTALLAVLPLLLLCGGVFELARPKPVVGTLQPLAGEWEGQIEMRGDDGSAIRSPAAMRAETTEGGRLCTIDLRIATEPGLDDQVFHFTHQLDDTGRSIATKDDLKVGLVDGPGKVIESVEKPGLWKAGFRAKQRDGHGISQCVWTVQGNELKIARKDLLGHAGFRTERSSIVTLKRREPPDEPKTVTN